MSPTPPPPPEPIEFQLVRHPNYHVNAIPYMEPVRIFTTQATLTIGACLDITPAGITLLTEQCLEFVPFTVVERLQWLNG